MDRTDEDIILAAFAEPKFDDSDLNECVQNILEELPPEEREEAT